MSAKSTLGATCKPIKRYRSSSHRRGFAPDPTEGAYSASPNSWLVGRGGEGHPSLPGPAGSQIVVLGDGKRHGRRLCMTLRVVTDSTEKSVVALRQLLPEVSLW